MILTSISLSTLFLSSLVFLFFVSSYYSIITSYLTGYFTLLVSIFRKLLKFLLMLQTLVGLRLGFVMRYLYPIIGFRCLNWLLKLVNILNLNITMIFVRRLHIISIVLDNFLNCFRNYLRQLYSEFRIIAIYALVIISILTKIDLRHDDEISKD